MPPRPDRHPRSGCTTAINIALPLSVVAVSVAVLLTVLFAPQLPATNIVGQAATGQALPPIAGPSDSPHAPRLPADPLPANQIRLEQRAYTPPEQTGTAAAVAQTQTAYPYPYPGATQTAAVQQTNAAATRTAAAGTVQPTTAVPNGGGGGDGGGGGGSVPTSTGEPTAAVPTDTLLPPTDTPVPETPTNTPSPTITPEPRFFTCIPGETVELAGEDAPPNSDLIVFFNGRSAGGGSSDRNGNYSIRLRIGPERPDVYLLEIKTRERRILIREAACIVPAPTPRLLPDATTAP